MDDLKQNKGLCLDELISRPILACIDAQKDAAFSTWDFVKEVGLQPGEEGKPQEAVMMSFSFLSDGKMATITVPLMTVVSIPNFGIDYLDIDFRASIQSTDSQNRVYAYYSASKDSSGYERNEFVSESNLDVKVRVAQDDIPAGLSKVLSFLEANIRVYNKKIDPYREFGQCIADAFLIHPSRFELVKGVPWSLTSFTDGANVVPLEGNRINDSDLLEVQTLDLVRDEGDYLESLNPLAAFPKLYNLRLIGLDLTEMRSFDLTAVSQVKNLFLYFRPRPDSRVAEDSSYPVPDFSRLRWLENLSIRNWEDSDDQRIVLSNSTRMKYLHLESCRVGRLDISACRNLERIELEDCWIDEIVVWNGFNDGKFDIKRRCRKWITI